MMPAQRTAPGLKVQTVHFCSAGNQRGKRANDRNETSKNDRELSVFGKEGLSLGHLLLINPLNRAVIDLVAEVVPDGVRNGVPEAGAKSDSEERTEWVEDARGAGGAGDKDK